MHDFPRDPWQPDVQEPAMLYVLCEGLFNMNNSTLARYDLEDGWMAKKTNKWIVD